ncbi:oligosaccharide flippase family protein [Chromohalobacter israelensis]
MKKVIYNAFYLTVIQGLGYLSPLLVSYMLVNRSGLDVFGKYSLYFAIGLYCQVLFDMGHQFTATRRIASANGKVNHISGVFWNAYAAKVMVFVSTILIIFVAGMIIDIHISPLLAALFYGASVAAIPIWFFHATDRFRLIAVLIFSSRVTSLIIIYFLYESGDSVSLILFSQSLPNLILVIFICWLLLKKRILMPISWPSLKPFNEFSVTYHVMLSNLGGSSMANLPVLILGSMKGDYITGVYAGVDRLIKVLSSALIPLSQAAFPVNCKNFSKSSREGVYSVLKFSPFILAAFIFLAAAAWLGRDYYFRNFKLPDGSEEVLLLLFVWLFWGVVNNIVGIQGLLAAGLGKAYNISTWCATLLTVVFLIIFTPQYGAKGAAISVAMGEALMTIAMLAYVLWLWYRRVFKLPIK